MCYLNFAVGVVQDARGALNAVGGTATHELGHILGMSHDDVDSMFVTAIENDLFVHMQH